jgi:hypothetical protein
MYNKSHHRQDGFFPFSRSHLHNEQGSLNEVLNTYKSFDLMKLFLFYNIMNLIDYEYIKGSFLFKRISMQRSFYIFMIKKIWIVQHAIILINYW